MPTGVIAFFRNGLGNFVMYTPALRALASLDPSGKVDVCIDGGWSDNRRQALIDMITPLPFVEELVNYPGINLAKGYKTWFYTRHTYPCKGYDTFKIKDPRFDVGIAWRHEGKHEIEFYVDLVRRFCGFTGPTPGQFVAVDDSFTFEKKRPVVVLCNGSYGHLAPSKVWPGFPELAETIKNYYDCDVVKIGYEKELSDVVDFDYDFVGKLTMPQTAKIIRECDLFITTDTCNMHVGDALGVPMVVLWGGSILTKNKPLSDKAVIIHRGLKCQPCHDPDRFQNCVNYQCLSGIKTGDVMREARRILGD